MTRLQFDEGARQVGLHHLLWRTGLVLALPFAVPQFAAGSENGELPVGPDLVHKGPIRTAARLVDVAQVRPDAEVVHHGRPQGRVDRNANILRVDDRFKEQLLLVRFRTRRLEGHRSVEFQMLPGSGETDLPGEPEEGTQAEAVLDGNHPLSDRLPTGVHLDLLKPDELLEAVLILVEEARLGLVIEAAEDVDLRIEQAVVTRDDVGDDDGSIQPVHLRAAAHGHPPAVRLHKGIGRPDELDLLALDDRFRNVIESRRSQEIQAVLVIPGRIEIGLGHGVVRVNHEVLKRLTAGRHFHLVLVHVPLEFIHIADVLVGRELNLGLSVIGREFTHALIEVDGAVHVVRLEGQGPLHALVQLECGRVAQDAPAVQFEEVGRQGGAPEPHRSGARHAGITEREGPIKLAFALE